MVAKILSQKPKIQLTKKRHTYISADERAEKVMENQSVIRQPIVRNGRQATVGYVREDERNFAPEAIHIMQTASRHVRYLINEGYDLKQASTFVGNHFLLSERQRLAIMRSLATNEQLAGRRDRQVQITDLDDKEVWIDGFNTIITLEVMFSEGILFECMDGTIRDLAAECMKETKTQGIRVWGSERN